MYEKYERILPGSADRILALSEREQSIRDRDNSSVSRNDTVRIYGSIAVSVLLDEWPVVPLHVDWSDLTMSGRFEPGMVICVESLIAEDGSESFKLETQVLVTETGCERLDSFPLDCSGSEQ